VLVGIFAISLRVHPYANRTNAAGRRTPATLENVELASPRSHPVLENLGVALPESQDDQAIPSVTRSGIVLDGKSSIQEATRLCESSVRCLIHDLSDEDALSWIVRKYRPSSGFNAFLRIRIALELEPFLRCKARANQTKGGIEKALSNLTEAERIDVRSEIAEIAGVGVGNVTKVKQLIPLASPEVLEALHLTQIRIHRAWIWRNKSHREQRELLSTYLSNKSLRLTVAKLLSRRLIDSSLDIEPRSLAAGLQRLAEMSPSGFQITVLKMQGAHLLLTSELARVLEKQMDFSTCPIEPTLEK
jgi:hypothetical protein